MDPRKINARAVTDLLKERGHCSDDNGLNREVYIFEELGFVLKVGKGGTMCNAVEGVVWNMVKGTSLARYFAEVFAYDPQGKWVVMKYMDPYDSALISADEYDEFDEKIWDLGVDDMHQGNVGMHPDDGRLVAIDYGYMHPEGAIEFTPELDDLMAGIEPGW